jgi:hypothetical protein
MSKDHKVDYDPEGLAHVPSHSGEGEVIVDNTIAHDAVFGDITEGGPNYRNVKTL